MPNYQREYIPGGSYFFTLVTHERQPWLCEDAARMALRATISEVRQKWPFAIEAWVLLPDHLHCIWRLPEGDADFSTRWRLIKSGVTKRLRGESGASRFANAPYREDGLAASRLVRGEKGLWQRRFWEHAIRDEADFRAHCDYIHYNPVKHGICRSPGDWPFSTLGRFVAQGTYPEGWGESSVPMFPESTGME